MPTAIEALLDWPADSLVGLAEGLLVTLQLLLGSVLLGAALAVPLALAVTHGSRRQAALARGYIATFRGTPLLVQLYTLYYGLSQFEWLRQSPAWWLLEDAFCCGLLALGLNLAAYVAEDLRAGIQAVPPGQVEAGRALGLSRWQCLRWVVLPAAWRIATPALGNELIAQVKATALVSAITVLDLTGVARRQANAAYTLDALLAAGAVYALMALLCALAVRVVATRYSPHGGRGAAAVATPAAATAQPPAERASPPWRVFLR